MNVRFLAGMIWIMRFTYLMLAAALLMPANARAATATTRPDAQEHRDDFHLSVTRKVGYDFIIRLPKNYDPKGAPSPLIIFLHGSGECGHDLSKVDNAPVLKYARATADFPFVVVVPQSPSEKDWWQSDDLNVMLDHVLKTYHVDPDRVYLTGLSMGAYGVWDWACHRPQAFAAIAPFAGEGNDDFAADLKHVPVWAFHGAKDKSVSPAEEVRMVNAVNRAGGSAKLKMFPNTGHGGWDQAYGKPALYDWFLQQTRWKDERK